MPGFELFGDKERKEVQDVMDSGVLMRYGFDAMRNGHWKTKELETALANNRHNSGYRCPLMELPFHIDQKFVFQWRGHW